MAASHGFSLDGVHLHDLSDAEQAMHLEDDLLDVARITHGKVVLHREVVDLSTVVQECFKAQETAAHARRLEFTLDAPLGVPVLGAPLRLEQVFGNLLTNAIKYTPPHGTVRVEIAIEEPHAAVRIIDSGIGIPEAMLERIFELFAQADRSLARAQGGMGIGLTVARTLVRLHGGDIQVRSAGLGQGSEFRVLLPVHVTASEDVPPQEARAPTIVSRKHVVVVEDSEDNRAMLEALLQMKGHIVTCAGSRPEGLERISRDPPDIALVDIGLPGFDGFELARRVRAGIRSAVPVFLVAITGYGQPEDRRRAAEAGFDAHLTKPVGLEEIERMLEAVESCRRMAPSSA